MKISFGKNKGREMEDILKVDRSYIEWLANLKEDKEWMQKFITEAKRLLETPKEEDATFPFGKNSEQKPERKFQEEEPDTSEVEKFAKEEFKMEVLQALEELKQKISEM